MIHFSWMKPKLWGRFSNPLYGSVTNMRAVRWTIMPKRCLENLMPLLLCLAGWLAVSTLAVSPLHALGPESNHPAPTGSYQTSPNPAAGSDSPPEFNRMERAPSETEGVGIAEKRGATLPLDARFFDEQGKSVTLGELVKGDKPIVLNIGYYGCPMLCGLVVNGMIDTFKELSFTPGEQFRVITISIDPTEKHPLAMKKKRNVIGELGRPQAAGGWHFLTGEEREIKRVTEAVGFGYRWDQAQRQYVHTAVMILLTPDGRISRYLYGIQFPAKTVRLSLVEAGEGKIGSPMDQLLLFCFHFDPSSGSYSLAAMNLMRLAAVLSVLALSGFVGVSLWRERAGTNIHHRDTEDTEKHESKSSSRVRVEP